MKKNPWKLAFLSLLTIVVVIVLVLSYFLFAPSSEQSIPKEAKKQHDIEFHVKTDKADLNGMINRYLKQENFNGEVYLNKDVELYGTVDVFSEKMHYKMTFTPKALKNGDLLLKQKSVTLGKIHLPVSYILRFIDTTQHLPDWVIIKPSDKLLYIQLQKMKLDSDAKVEVNQFDLAHNNILFTLYFPNK
ncbi:YpmS family protein [Heyndrickxia ginsengihumi]|uniref:YpmS family protein n=1 Tax=Heyndrickxia ginsengihumi TaxID=363870 RepID=A0A0A6VEQ1_9BACI|nr:YpmS family protein [Heyndrickxia ginsengihumi]KHD86056.1 hypothetical protein NG54_05395 [Heyndrickxia ginsengihumi]MBE6184228.1 DUF2140 family protein [Bacillus sp. (in: firmicutes)]MCM3023476.1 YpmS family protein [Heyndrickxia ginsengihumi]NEY20368.1 YpmS family protein [Heyndrickxia ginsengihumi]